MTNLPTDNQKIRVDIKIKRNVAFIANLPKARIGKAYISLIGTLLRSTKRIWRDVHHNLLN